MTTRILAVLNADMFGMSTEPGEYVNWSEPDLIGEDAFPALGLGTPEEYAAANPHMIVWEFGA